jgi:CelD/BcsL family acetyltransferase involved in cellulose biosynthesis
VARRSWQSTSTTGDTLSHPELGAFLRDAHAGAAQRGMLDLAILRLDGQAIAFGYNYYANGSVYGLRSGYDAQWATCGVGTVLLASSLQDSIARGDRCFDLGVATKEVKRCWQPRLAPIGRLTHYPANSPRAQLLALKHRLQRRDNAAISGERPASPG